MLFPYPWFLVPLSFWHLAYLCFTNCQLSENNHLFSWPTKRSENLQESYHSHLEKGAPLQTLVSLMKGLALLHPLPDRTPFFLVEKRKRIRTPEVENPCLFLTLDRKQHQKEFKALRLVSLPLKSNGDWKRILPWRRPNCFRGLRTSQVIPTWKFFVLRFRKWNVKKLVAYCRSSKLTIFPCLRIEQNRKKAVFLEWSPFNSPKSGFTMNGPR